LKAVLLALVAKKHLLRGQGRKKINPEALDLEFQGCFVYFSQTSILYRGGIPLDGMKSIRFLLTLLVSLGLSVATAAQGIDFEEGDFETAQAKAAKEGKMLMLFVCGDVLEVCEIMEKDIFVEKEIGDAFNPYFVSYRLDAKQLEASPYFAGVRILSIPEFIFFDSKGNAQYREKKLHDHDELLQMATSARNKSLHLDSRTARYKAGYRDPGFVQRYLIEMDAAGHDMKIQCREYLKKIPREGLMETENWIIATIGAQSVTDVEYQHILAHKSAFVEQYGEAPVSEFLGGVFSKSLNEAATGQNGQLFTVCKKVAQQLWEPTEAAQVMLQGELAYYHAGKNWVAYQKSAETLFDNYQGDDAALLNDAAWAFHEYIPQPDALQKAVQWAQRSTELLPASWNFHTLGALQLKTGDLDSAEKSANSSFELSEPESNEAKEAQILLDRIKNSR
jgi:hypothetical protein